jgi:hypothetical protein
MKQEIILGLLRHVLTVAGGALVAKGLTDDSQLGEAAGAACTLIGFVWSILHKRQAGLKAGPLVMVGILGGMGLMVSGCVHVNAMRAADGSQTITVSAFLENVNGGSYTSTDPQGHPMTLMVTQATPDEQAIALLSTGVVDLGKSAMLFASKQATNAAPATNAPAANTAKP